MNDREFLIHQRDAIDVQLQTASTGDLVLRLPEKLPTDAPLGHWSGCVSPLPIFDGHEPVVTGNEFDEGHPARDMAYLNWTGRPNDPPEIFGGVNGDRYYVPSNTIPVVAPGPSTVWYAKLTKWGYSIRLDHHNWTGLLLNSYMTHMSELFIPEHEPGPGGQYVYAGQPLGYVGCGPTHANHNHFELWQFGVPNPPAWNRPGLPLDPAIYLPHFGRAIVSPTTWRTSS